MKIYQKLAIVLSLVPFAASFAGGQAGVNSYSESTRNNFLKSCSEGAEKSVCECVLRKMKVKYSEDQFKKFESQRLAGANDKAYAKFYADATASCSDIYKTSAQPELSKAPSAEPVKTQAVPASRPAVQPAQPTTQPAAQPAQPAAQPVAKPVNTPAQTTSSQALPMDPLFSGMETMILKAVVENDAFKANFVNRCVNESREYLGKAQANASCACAYGRILKDDRVVAILLNSVNTGENPADFEKWGYDVVAPCLPNNFTPEMENALMDECKKNVKDSQNVCPCVVAEIKNRYTVKTLLKAAIENEKQLEKDMIDVASQCSSK